MTDRHLSATTEVIFSDVDFILVEERRGPKGEKGDPGTGSDLINDAVVALDSTYSSMKIMELMFPFSLSSFGVSPSVAEMGSTVNAVTLSWATNYPPDTASIDQGVGAVQLPATSVPVSGLGATTNKTFTLTVTRNGVQKTAQATLAFLNRVYWGVFPEQTLDPVLLSAMSSQLSGGRGRSLTFDCSGGRFFHLAFPKRFGLASFKINNLTYSDVTVTEVPLTNPQGFTEAYYVYYCNVVQYGAAITLVVS